MSSFDPNADLNRALDFRLLANTAITIFRRKTIMNEACDWLRDRGYQIIVLDAAVWDREADLHTAFAAAFDFPDYYGRNLDALNDCMRDVVSHDYGWDPGAIGLAVAFDRYDAFTARHPRPAQAVLDIIAGSSRSAALLGHRLLCMVQSNDPEISFDREGANPGDV